jgi:shikimate 5-dehydrogenase
MYFIGVTTGQSSINRVFPRWAERLGLGDCALRGMDFPLGAPAADYRAAVDFIRRDPLSLGALVTTHKIAIFDACRDRFDALDPLTRSLGEVGSIYKRGGRLHGRAVDPITSRHALDAQIDAAHWRGGAEALILGVGGAGTALAWQLAQRAPAAGRPARLHAVDRVPARLEHLRALHAAWPGAAPLETHCIARAADADAALARLPAGSLVANATGLGKDAPGSPLTDAAVFPERGVVWEFNYRGQLVFLEQARAQAAARGLRVADGWTYFLHGWTTVIADVFAVEIPPRGARFDELARIAAEMR